MTQKGVTVNDIPRYVPPRNFDALLVKLSKNQQYPIKIPAMPKWVHVTMNIAPKLMKMTYIDHGILEYPEWALEPYVT